MDGNGNYVEVTPDSLETDSVRLARPKFKSDGGRVVYCSFDNQLAIIIAQRIRRFESSTQLRRQLGRSFS